MNRIDCDVTILGSGLGGSLLAMVLQRLGLRVVMMDRCVHPRFTIGESSTPIADMLLARVCRRYTLPEIAPLASYGATRRAHPELSIGLKRGFSYFDHTRGQAFEVHADHRNELLVAASTDAETADSHWLRGDIDAFLAQQARSMGVDLIENMQVRRITKTSRWAIRGQSGRQEIECHCRFVVDATGPAGTLLAALGIVKQPDGLKTHSRSLYAHFEGVTSWDTLLEAWGADRQDHPYRCDQAALHHVLDQAWMWQLTFDSGVMSAGFVMSGNAASGPQPPDAKGAWDAMLSTYPSLKQQFLDAKIVAPAAGLVATGRLQYLAERAAGEGWICLPFSAGFIDPLHSTGIAHTLSAVWRLAHLFEGQWNTPSWSSSILALGEAIRAEIRFLDRLVAGCYETMPEFAAFSAFSMVYFVAAIRFEARLSTAGLEGLEDQFLCADDSLFSGMFARVEAEVGQLQTSHFSTDQVCRFVDRVREEIEPLDRAGLLDANARNMYRHTAPVDKLRIGSNTG